MELASGMYDFASSAAFACSFSQDLRVLDTKCNDSVICEEKVRCRVEV
jgi:hypothetical protein